MLQANNSRLTFRAVEVFVAIVEEGAVTAAAKRLGASPSAVSLQLSNLEKALGSKLIERSSQRFCLTPAGELFHPRAIRLLDEVTSATAILSSSGTTSRILLEVAMVEDFNPLAVAPWLTAIKEHHPNMRFRIRNSASHESHAALGSRSADIILAVEGTDTVDWIEEHPILNDPYVLARSSQVEGPNTIENLSKYPFVRYSREQLMGRQIEAHLRRNRCVPPREHEFSNNRAVFAMIEAQGGWAITTATALSTIIGLPHKIEAFPLHIPSFTRQISLYARKDALGDLPAQFAALMRKTLEDNMLKTLKTTFEFLAEQQSVKIVE